MKKYKEASEFLQNAVYINLKVPNEERVYKEVLISSLNISIDPSSVTALYLISIKVLECFENLLFTRELQQCNVSLLILQVLLGIQ